ncbi:SAM-dependent methyltransferase [Salinactinospora qingdaonensis]|uniref:SAM-dependent methyltransferase n=1 Tax=Salinactinospora qingdaonensis TaxID=702744 RepID=A0ABP7EWM1_9ACTN
MSHDPLANSGSDGYTPPLISADTPTPARIYDYLLGGKDNFAVDRDAARALEQHAPHSRALARENRRFLERVVRYLVAEAGIRQIIDLGSGLPTQDNVHQIAQRHAPETRVVYVDHDPIVLAHSQALLAENDRTAVITADIAESERIRSHPETRALIDFTQPWALLCMALFHFVEDPSDIVAAFRAHMPSGSFLALSHGTHESTEPEDVDNVKRVYQSTTSSLLLRTPAEIAAIFTGFELVDPGLVPVMEWRSDSEPLRFDSAGGYGGVAVLP